MNFATALLVVMLAGADVGQIAVGPDNARYLGLADRVAIEVDPAMTIVGDRLHVMAPASTNRDEGQTVAGTVTITSIGPTGVVGVVTEATREIPLPAPLVPTWSEDEGSRIYHPLLAWLAENFATDPSRPTPIAVTDVTDADGARTARSDLLRDELANALCGRGAFVCVTPDRIATSLWRRGAATSAGLIDEELERLGVELGAVALIEGSMIAHDDQIETVVTVHTADGSPPPTWWRFIMPMSRAPLAGPDRVTVAARKAPTARLTIRLGDLATFGSIKPDELTYVDLQTRLVEAGLSQAPLRAESFFAEIDGRRYPLLSDGLLFDGEVAAGNRHIAVGFTPVATTANGSVALSPPVVRRMSVGLTPSRGAKILVIGEMRGADGALVVRRVDQ